MSPSYQSRTDVDPSDLLLEVRRFFGKHRRSGEDDGQIGSHSMPEAHCSWKFQCGKSRYAVTGPQVVLKQVLLYLEVPNVGSILGPIGAEQQGKPG